MRLGLDLPPAGSREFDIAGFGLNSVDLLAVVARHPWPNTKQPIQKLARLPGGQAATAMVTCARLGWRARYIGRFAPRPLLFVNAGRDGTIPRTASEALFAAAADPKEILWFEEATHQRLPGVALKAMWQFLRPHLELEEPATAGR